MNTIFEKLGGTYHDENGYLIPNLIPPETPQTGAWGATVSAPSENGEAGAVHAAAFLRKDFRTH